MPPASASRAGVTPEASRDRSSGTFGKNMITPGSWFIFPLTLEGSYLQNIERPASNCCDTFQYWIAPNQAYDIRTFSIDKTLRILELDVSIWKQEDVIPTLLEIAHRTYSDIIAKEIRIDVCPQDTVTTIIHKVTTHGLHPNVEWTLLDFPLWLPENAVYESLPE